jgi:hypothetical protein
MINIDLTISIFLLCASVGLVLLLVGLVLDDIVGGVLDPFHLGFDLGGVGVAPLLLVFLTMFGVGGLVAVKAFSLDAGWAAAAGLIVGIVSAALWPLLARLRRRRALGRED